MCRSSSRDLGQRRTSPRGRSARGGTSCAIPRPTCPARSGARSRPRDPRGSRAAVSASPSASSSRQPSSTEPASGSPASANAAARLAGSVAHGARGAAGSLSRQNAAKVGVSWVFTDARLAAGAGSTAACSSRDERELQDVAPAHPVRVHRRRARRRARCRGPRRRPSSRGARASRQTTAYSSSAG